MSLLADLLNNLVERRFSPFDSQNDTPIEELCTELMSHRGDVSGMALAQQIMQAYAGLDDLGRLNFYRYLSETLDIDPVAATAALAVYQQERSKSAYQTLAQACEPRRQELIRRLNQVPCATAQLVALRADLRKQMRQAPEIANVDVDLRQLFASWFNRGFLLLRPINWSTPADILEKIIAYEAVHAIDSWDDLRRRLQPEDRRCFGFFHPAMPNEPLIFVEVALTHGVASSIQDLLAEERTALDPRQADTAVFYSISNCQAGLAGISFGNSLIKQVVEDLSRALPHIKTFVTLSPIPEFCNYLSATQTPMAEDKALQDQVASYLLNAKDKDGLPWDPVARFHCNNGALVHDVHLGADLSEKGQRQSACTMVNYLYQLNSITSNHEAFARDQQIAASRKVAGLAQKDQKRQGKSAG